MAMETRKIGSLDVSIVGLGTNNFGFRMDEADVPAVVDAAKPTVASVIAGATTAAQVGANAAAAWQLSAEEVAEVDGMTSAP
jgi:aryl-alcohol dehydrogenase-like predicted oxidoreductase